MIEQELPGWRDWVFFTSGPPGMVDAIFAILWAMGIPEGRSGLNISRTSEQAGKTIRELHRGSVGRGQPDVPTPPPAQQFPYRLEQ
jgi:hypothetical protein